MVAPLRGAVETDTGHVELLRASILSNCDSQVVDAVHRNTGHNTDIGRACTALDRISHISLLIRLLPGVHLDPFSMS
jgi:hypothetical protein